VNAPGTRNWHWDTELPGNFSEARGNAVFLATEMHDYFKAYPFYYNNLDFQITIGDPGPSIDWYAVSAITGLALTVSNEYAKSRDVVYHEYSHLMVYWLYGGRFIELDPVNNPTSEAFAMEEGFADYFSAAKQSNETIGEAIPDNKAGPDRHMVNSLTMEDFFNLSSAQERGQIIAGAVWDLKNNQALWYYLGQPSNLNQIVDGNAYWALWLAPHPTNFQDYALNMIDAFDAHGYEWFYLINDTFCDRGIETGYCGASKAERRPQDMTRHPLPEGFELTNYPNPFNSSTTIQFELVMAQNVRVSVYDVLGQELVVLINGHRESGSHSLQFIAEHLPSGVYLLQVKTGADIRRRTLILQK